jgi:hypothetical protein
MHCTLPVADSRETGGRGGCRAEFCGWPLSFHHSHIEFLLFPHARSLQPDSAGGGCANVSAALERSLAPPPMKPCSLVDSILPVRFPRATSNSWTEQGTLSASPAGGAEEESLGSHCLPNSPGSRQSVDSGAETFSSPMSKHTFSRKLSRLLNFSSAHQTDLTILAFPAKRKRGHRKRPNDQGMTADVLTVDEINRSESGVS